MHGEAVDGDDLEAVLEATERLLGAPARSASRPCWRPITYRYRGHSVADAGLAYRTREEIKEHQEHDPLVRVAERLREAGATRRTCARSTSGSRRACRPRCSSRTRAPSPSAAELAAGMYAAGSAEQFARMRPGSAFGDEALTFDAGLGR